MNSRTLFNLDNLSKFLVLDPYFNFKCCRNRNYFQESTNLESSIQAIIDTFKINPDVAKTTTLLLNLAKDNRLMYLYSIQETNLLKAHIESYLMLLQPNSLCELQRCFKHSLENYNGFKVVATTDLKKNIILRVLKSLTSRISPHEEEFLAEQKLDYSILWSSRYKCPKLRELGTAALLNHDCVPNCAFYSQSKQTNKYEITIITLKNIKQGEELFCYYGDNYFDVNNSSCECETCFNKCQKICMSTVKNLNNSTIHIEKEDKSKSASIHERKEFHKSNLVINTPSTKIFVTKLIFSEDWILKFQYYQNIMQLYNYEKLFLKQIALQKAFIPRLLDINKLKFLYNVIGIYCVHEKKIVFLKFITALNLFFRQYFEENRKSISLADLLKTDYSENYQWYTLYILLLIFILGSMQVTPSNSIYQLRLEGNILPDCISPNRNGMKVKVDAKKDINLLQKYGLKKAEIKLEKCDKTKDLNLIRKMHDQNQKKKNLILSYCHKFRAKFNVHLETRHSTEKHVLEFMNLRKKDRAKRRQIISSIRHQGNFILSTILKEIIPVCKTNTTSEKSQCELCKGFYSKKSIWKQKNSHEPKLIWKHTKIHMNQLI